MELIRDVECFYGRGPLSYPRSPFGQLFPLNLLLFVLKEEKEREEKKVFFSIFFFLSDHFLFLRKKTGLYTKHFC
jgi:hypothetical protein